MEINIDLFRRYQPSKKLGFIGSLTIEDCLNVKEDTIKTIVRIAGNYYYHKEKCMNIIPSLRKNNKDNCSIDGVIQHNGRIYLTAIFYYENNIEELEIPYSEFVRPGSYVGQYWASQGRGNNNKLYEFVFTEEQKRDIIKSILYQYIHNKYTKKCSTK